MSKYSYEFKKKIVKDYLSGKGGYRFLAQQYGIPDKKQIQKWVDASFIMTSYSRLYF